MTTYLGELIISEVMLHMEEGTLVESRSAAKKIKALCPTALLTEEQICQELIRESISRGAALCLESAAA